MIRTDNPKSVTAQELEQAKKWFDKTVESRMEMAKNKSIPSIVILSRLHGQNK